MTRALPALLAAALLAACARPSPRVTDRSAAAAGAPRVARDPLRGLRHTHRHDSAGPWAIDILEADLAACWRAVAVKGARGAVGRRTTSALLRALADSAPPGEGAVARGARGRAPVVVGGGVNADFFLFTPPGVPVGAMVRDGRVITGPTNRPVVWFDAAGHAVIGELAARGVVTVGAESLTVRAWNRVDGAVRWIDRGFGDSTAAGRGLVELVVDGVPARIVAVDTLASGVAIPAAGGVLVLDSTVAPSTRTRLAASRASVTWRFALEDAASGSVVAPREAVGGQPWLVRDSVTRDDIDRAGGAGFSTTRHPRTAIGLKHGGRTLVLVTVDGRQPGWSAGMSLRELSALMLALGATDALNLDGGGSTAMVVRRGDSLAVVNRPSDATGERPVANALALVRACR